MLYNANQDRSVNQRQDLEQLRKELKRWEGEGKAKKVDIGDTDEYQVSTRDLGEWWALVADPAQRLHKQNFLELTERARRNKPSSQRSQLPQRKEGGSSVEELEALEPTEPIEVD